MAPFSVTNIAEGSYFAKILNDLIIGGAGHVFVVERLVKRLNFSFGQCVHVMSLQANNPGPTIGLSPRVCKLQIELKNVVDREKAIDHIVLINDGAVDNIITKKFDSDIHDYQPVRRYFVEYAHTDINS